MLHYYIYLCERLKDVPNYQQLESFNSMVSLQTKTMSKLWITDFLNKCPQTNELLKVGDAESFSMLLCYNIILLIIASCYQQNTPID